MKRGYSQIVIFGMVYLAEGSFRDKSLKWEHTSPLGQSEPEGEKVGEVALNHTMKDLRLI